MSLLFASDRAALDELAPHANLICLQLSRREIEEGRVGEIVDAMMVLSDSTEHTRRLAGRLLFMVQGYEDDPRGLAQIPEVVRFVRAVDAAWPYWFHFFDVELGSDSLFNLLLMVLDIEVVEQKGGLVGMRIIDPAQTRAVLTERFRAMNLLHQLHGIGPDQTLARTRVIDEGVLSRFGK